MRDALNPTYMKTLSIFVFVLFVVVETLVASAAENPTWQVEWERTLAAAKKEGRINIYHWGPTYALDAGVFQKRYPDIKVVIVSGRGPQTQHRILAERRAKKFIADVHIDGIPNFYPAMFRTKALDPIRSALILPEVVDESKWWRGKHKYVDRERKYLITFANTPSYGTIAYNTNLVDPKQFKSYWDFLNPKWKGKIEARDVRRPGPGSTPTRFFYYNPKLGPEFLRRLFSEMDIGLFRDNRQGVDWLANGKFAFCFFCTRVPEARDSGLAVDTFRRRLKEGAYVAGQVGYMSLLNKAPHPNAAKVFINWFLSREGQITFQKAQAKVGSPRDSLRIDIPKDYIPPEDRRTEGVTYLEMDNLEILDTKPALKVIAEALAEAKKK